MKFLLRNSTPTVAFESDLNSLLTKRFIKFVFPTPESPTTTT